MCLLMWPCVRTSALACSHSPAHMGTKKKKPFRGPLTDRYSQPHSKRQQLLVEAGQCRECGSPLGRAVTICDQFADAFCAAADKARLADKAAAQAEAEKNSPLLAPSELQALPQLSAPLCVQLLYSNSNRRQAEQVEAALQQWDLQQNQPGAGRRFSLHQRWFKKFSAKDCEGHVLLVEVTKEFFAANEFFAAHVRGSMTLGAWQQIGVPGPHRAWERRPASWPAARRGKSARPWLTALLTSCYRAVSRHHPPVR
jgi:hypothetical protein